MILEKMSGKQYELDLIAGWRNKSLISLRANEETLKGQSQIGWANTFKSNEKYYFIYVQEKPKTLIGYCGLDKIHDIHRTAEMSLLVGLDYQKMGYGAEAVDLLLKVAFNDLNLNCVYIEVLGSTTNWNFWVKQGFKKEGTLRERFFKNGKYHYSTVGSITKTDWQLYPKPIFNEENEIY